MKILISYWYFRTVDLDRVLVKYFGDGPYPEIFADSGGFSAKTQGKPLDVRDYGAWLHRWRHWFREYANLDDLSSPDVTWTNQRILEDEFNLEPLPVFHTREPWAFLEMYLELYDYVALGGMVPYAGQQPVYMPWAVRCFQMAQSSGTLYHGFGVTSWAALTQLPWYSVDSSTWGQGFRFGAVPVFDPRRGRMNRIKLGDRRSYGFDPAQFADRERNTRRVNCALAALSFFQLEAWLTRRHSTPTDDRVRLYLADTDMMNFFHIKEGLKERTLIPDAHIVHY